MKPFLAQGGDQTLDAIYLDTASVWSMVKPPSKVGFCPYTPRLASDLTGPFFPATEGRYGRACGPDGTFPSHNVLFC